MLNLAWLSTVKGDKDDQASTEASKAVKVEKPVKVTRPQGRYGILRWLCLHVLREFNICCPDDAAIMRNAVGVLNECLGTRRGK